MPDVYFYPGLHVLGNVHRFERCMISVNRLRTRKKPLAVRRWLLDSAAFTELAKYGAYRHGVDEYAALIHRAAEWGTLEAATSQDFMCERFMLERTGGTVESHQAQTIERYDALRRIVSRDVYVLPVLQGWTPRDYVVHLRAYGDRLAADAWVGVGSVCKRNARPDAVAAVLHAIKHERPDLRLHGFGLKVTALQLPEVLGMLHSADSMAWSFAARYEGRDSNDWREAKAYADRVDGIRHDGAGWQQFLFSPTEG